MSVRKNKVVDYHNMICEPFITIHEASRTCSETEITRSVMVNTRLILYLSDDENREREREREEQERERERES